MYLPLRLGKGFNPEELGAGGVLDPAVLLTRKKPLVIRGAAGSGKTTWVRWTFRRLVEMPAAVPFMVELRRLAYVWNEKKARGAERTILAYLREWVAESGVSGWEEAIPQVFKAGAGPRPVLLIDGWDELGELGEELRGKLTGFLEAHPRVLVVVSSRPYGASRPSGGDGFEVYDLQPLSNEEVSSFTHRFHHRVYGEDETRALESAQRFKKALEGSPEALSLARTPLLLTMMLLISRSKPLPDKRHLLYKECILNLLSALPARREQEGARLQQHQWRPQDSAERWRVLAEFAFQMQSAGYEREKRGQIVGSADELEHLLPKGWKLEEKRGFLAWLVGAAGVMIDRADGTLAFAHLSFQEYLTASHLEVNAGSDEDRISTCRERMGDVDWWETLRLWAAIVEDRKPAHLVPTLRQLVQGEPAGFWLVGAILADGQGEEVFEEWCQGLALRFHVGEAAWSDVSARAWRSSQQEEGRRAIAERWPQLSAGWTWLAAVLAWDWSQKARIEAREREAFEKIALHAGERQGVGRSRILLGFNPLWPLSPEELVFLRLFPSRRGASAAQLQMVLSLGGSGDDLKRVARHRLVLSDDQEAREWARDLARNWARDLARYWPRYWARDLAQHWAQDLARGLAWNWERNLARSWERNLARDLARNWAQNWGRYWGRYWAGYWERDLARDLALGWARDLALGWARDLALGWARDLGYQEAPVWFIDWVAVELFSPGRAWTRAAVARSPQLEKPLHHMLHAACLASLNPDADHASLDQALAAYPKSEDPLWPALARHLARCSTDEDRALLMDLAQHPEKRGEPLASGLKYYVRGDLVFEDGSEVTLDALCNELGLPQLPYLEEMPPEIDVD